MKAHLATILTLLIIIGGGYLICTEFTTDQITEGIVILSSVTLISVLLYYIYLLLKVLYLTLYDFIDKRFFKQNKEEKESHWSDY